jgi:outer membrane protein OmpA-like peptidoglycan-associated protein
VETTSARPNARAEDNMIRRSTLALSAAIVGVPSLFLAPIARSGEAKPLPAEAGDFALKVEPGVAFPLTDPQARLFKTGGGQSIKALWTLNKYLDLGPSASLTALPVRAGTGEPGTAWAFGGSLRLKRPHDAPDDDTFRAISPWADVDALYVRTDGLNRPGFSVAGGLAVPVDAARVFWLGPFVRYFEILQPNRAGYDNHDAKILSVGISLEVGSGVRREPELVAVSEVPPVIVTKEVFVCPDRDKDDVPDKVDHCPDVAGPMNNSGCPMYQKIVVKRDKLELKEKLFFAWNQAVLQEVSFSVLDEVAQALKDNKGFRVQVEGHTSSEGDDDHNQTLSEKRAEAVLNYLAEHGVERERLIAKGFGASVPIDSNATVEGREKNRRVEFVVHFIILNDGSK